MKIFEFADLGHTDPFPFFSQRATVDTDSFAVHGHSFSELVVVLSGSGLHVTPAETYPVCRGDVFVLNGKTVHGFKDIRRLELCNLMFDPDQLIKLQGRLADSPGYQALFVIEPFCRHQGFRGKLQLGEAELSTVIDLIEAIEREQATRPEGYKSLLAAYFMQLVVLLSRYYVSSSGRSTEAVLRLVRTITYVEKNYHLPLNLADLAATANLSKNQFLRVFKKAFGVTPMLYLTKHRVAKARRLLEQGDLSITQIAFETGFNSSTYFSRQFRRVTGRTPQNYRRLFGRAP